MDIKKINEQLTKIINEMDIDPSFNDYINQRREDQKQTYMQDAEQYKKWADLDNEDDYDTKRYKKYLEKALGKQEADDILKNIYNKCHIDLEHGGIKEIEVPKNRKELAHVLNDFNHAIILKSGSYISLLSRNNDGTITSYYASSADDSSFIDQVKEPGRYGKSINITKASNVSRALNKGLFDQAWLVYGDSTESKRQERQKAYRGSDADLRSYADSYWDADKSGYAKRDLKRELANLIRDARKQNFDKVKASAADIRKNLIRRIKDSDIEDISTKDLQTIVNNLKDIEDTYFYNYDSDDIKQSQEKLEARIANLNSIIDSIFDN